MGTNPDNKTYEGLAAPDGAPYLVPAPGMLRFVEKEVDNHGTPAKARILQRYEWSVVDRDFNWYDVQLVEVS